MKTKIILLAGVLATGVLACNQERARFLDLSTNEAVELEKDEKTGLMVNSETGKPVKVYVDRETNDTIWGATGKVVNGKVVKAEDGEWKIKYDDDEYKAKMGDDYKIKAGDGEYKVKNGDYKKEVEKDGDITIKTGDKKIKIDGETGERKVKKDD